MADALGSDAATAYPHEARSGCVPSLAAIEAPSTSSGPALSRSCSAAGWPRTPTLLAGKGFPQGARRDSSGRDDPVEWYRTPSDFLNGPRFQIDTHWSYDTRLTHLLRLPVISRPCVPPALGQDAFRRVDSRRNVVAARPLCRLRAARFQPLVPARLALRLPYAGGTLHVADLRRRAGRFWGLRGCLLHDRGLPMAREARQAGTRHVRIAGGDTNNHHNNINKHNDDGHGGRSIQQSHDKGDRPFRRRLRQQRCRVAHGATHDDDSTSRRQSPCEVEAATAQLGRGGLRPSCQSLQPMQQVARSLSQHLPGQGPRDGAADARPGSRLDRLWDLHGGPHVSVRGGLHIAAAAAGRCLRDGEPIRPFLGWWVAVRECCVVDSGSLVWMCRGSSRESEHQCAPARFCDGVTGRASMSTTRPILRHREELSLCFFSVSFSLPVHPHRLHAYLLPCYSKPWYFYSECILKNKRIDAREDSDPRIATERHGKTKDIGKPSK
ncbi:hypothetical protein VTK73DRAFT_2096 [Phialemonium thermophilum]|uniref:Uncharacterized protein n=1 Tax=Phialemonium thermophilum TaxID=223376 RepID=A0ABR3VSJ9_9PEZI